MAIVNSWNGGIKIVTQAEIDAQRQEKDVDQGQVKFDTCKNRSAEEVVRIKRSCCSSTKVRGYECLTRKIENLIPQVCSTCTLYQKK